MGQTTIKDALDYILNDKINQLSNFISEYPHFIDLSISVDTEDRLLHFACRRKKVKSVMLLMNHNANQAIANKNGETPLMISLKDDACFKALLNDNKNQDQLREALLMQNSIGETVLHLANFSQSEKIMAAALMISVEFLTEILTQGIKIDRNMTPLRKIIRVGRNEPLERWMTILEYTKDCIDKLHESSLSSGILADCGNLCREEVKKYFSRFFRFYSKEYSEVKKLFNNDKETMALLDLEFNNEQLESCKQMIEILKEAKSLKYLPIFVKSNVNDNHFQTYVEERKKTTIRDNIPYGNWCDIENAHQTFTLQKNIPPNDPHLKFSNIIGQALGVKTLYNECYRPVSLLLKHGDKLTKENLPPKNRRFLLYGPPGTGKSLLCRTLASELDVPFIRVNIADLQTSYWGDTEKNLKSTLESARTLALTATRQTNKAPGACVVILDEFDSIASKVNSSDTSYQFLIKINSAVKQFFEEDNWPELIICASVNRMGIIDPPIKQRMGTLVLCVLPDIHSRGKLFLHYVSMNDIKLKKERIRGLICPDNLLKDFCEKTHMMSGRDIAMIINSAVMTAKQQIHRWKLENDVYVCSDEGEECSAADLIYKLKDGESIDSLKIEKAYLEQHIKSSTPLSDKEFTEYCDDASSNDASAKQLFDLLKQRYLEDKKPEEDNRKEDGQFASKFIDFILKFLDSGSYDTETFMNDDMIQQTSLKFFNSSMKEFEQKKKEKHQEWLKLSEWTIMIQYFTEEMNIIKVVVSKEITISELLKHIILDTKISECSDYRALYEEGRLSLIQNNQILEPSDKLMDILTHYSSLQILKR